MRSPLLALAAAGLAAGVAGGASGQESSPWPAPSADPLRFASLPLDPEAGTALSPGSWTLSVTSSYFNVWYLSWQPGAIHRELGREGQPLSADELRTLEQRYPNDAIYFVDLEGWRADLRLARGLGGGLAVTIDLPWVDTTRPHWDRIAEDFHAFFEAGPGGRDLFPRGRNTVYVRGKDGRIERLDGLSEAGFGDAAVSLGGPLGHAFGGEHRWLLAVEAPTGTRGTVRGSGGWDLGARWFARWRWRRSQLDGALGFTRLDPNGDLLGARRSDTWHAGIVFRRSLSRVTEARVIGRLESSPLAGFTDAKVGAPGFTLTIGVRRALGAGWVAFDLGENYPLIGVTPDWSFHLSAGARLGRAARAGAVLQ